MPSKLISSKPVSARSVPKFSAKQAGAAKKIAKPTIALVGNPNCGKTTLFNALTGATQRVGNWPGVTVERKEGSYRHQGQEVVVVDLPGVYSLDVEDASTGLDELVARDYLLTGGAGGAVGLSGHCDECVCRARGAEAEGLRDGEAS